jgi:hypothetical protein
MKRGTKQIRMKLFCQLKAVEGFFFSATASFFYNIKPLGLGEKHVFE